MIALILLAIAALLLLATGAAATQRGPFRPPRGRHWYAHTAPGTAAQRLRWAA